MNETAKKLVSCLLLAVIALGCFFGVSKWQASPETHSTSIAYLNEKQATVLKLTAASTAASAAISALPGDTGSAISEKLADLTSDFLIVLCAILLEKYLLTITGWAVFRFVLPTVCILLMVYRFRQSGWLRRLALRLGLFGLAVWLAVPGGIAISHMIEDTFQTSMAQTIDAAQSAADDLEQSADTGEEQTGFWSGVASSIKDTVAGATEKFEKLLSDMLEALAVLIVTSCVIPVLVLLFLLWLVKMLTGAELGVRREEAEAR